MRGTAVALLVALLAALLAAAGCSSSHATPASSTVTTIKPRTAPTPAADLDIALDPQGHPYDAPLRDGETSERRSAGPFHAVGGHVRVIDGSLVIVEAARIEPTEAKAVEFGSHENLDLSIVWQQRTYGGKRAEDVLGVRLDAVGSAVVRWGPFEDAYGTDGGMGGLTSQAAIDALARASDSSLIDLYKDQQYYLRDLDGIAGTDTIAFSNGNGDGAFPMARGFDANGELVALMLWDPRYPWRLAVPDGTPPPTVTEREAELQACIDGRREIDGNGRCSSDS